MKGKSIWHIGLALAAGLTGIWIVVSGLQVARAASKPAAPNLIDRADPVILAGTNFDGDLGAPLDELVLYSYQSGVWQPIPFQIDEVSIAAGGYVSFEDGLLDDNDELVFMAPDGGESAPAEDWPDDAQARLYPRYAITVTDPLNPGDQAWTYLYRSATLTRTAQSYVAWDEPAQTLTAISYTAGFSPSQFLGFSSLTLNGGMDVLDRQKLRLDIEIYLGPIPVSSTTFTEESISDFLTSPVTVTLPAVGPVRAIGGGDLQSFAFYGSRLDLSVAVPLTDFITSGLRVHFKSARVSLDLNDPTTSGMSPATYYNNNLPAGVAIDGTPDSVPATAADWSQVSGAIGGLVTVVGIDPGNGTLTNYYKDNGAVDPNDTGDGRSYGDAGLKIDAPSSNASIGLVTIDQATYILPGGGGNVGSSYQDRVDNPLQAATAAQTYSGSDLIRLFLPLVIRDS